MSSYPICGNEDQRLCRLDDVDLLGTPAEPVLDAFTRLASNVTGLPVALLNLISRERTFVKSAVGVPQGMSLPRQETFCAWTIASDGILEIEDARQDPRFADMPAVTGPLQAVHYVGAPLVFPGGEKLGTICLIGHQSGRLQPHERKLLADLAESIVQVLLVREREDQLKKEQLLSHAQSIAELSPVGLFAVDAQGRVVHANKPWQAMWGLDAASPQRYDWLSRVHPEDRPGIAASWQAALTSGQMFSERFRLAKEGGKPTWFSMRMVPVTTGVSQSAFVGAAADITQMKELSFELAHANTILEAVLENLPCGLGVYDENLSHVLSNQRLFELQGLPTDLFAQPKKGLADLLRHRARLSGADPTQIERLVTELLAHIRSQQSLVEEVPQRDGSTLELRSRRMANGWQVQVLTDITEAHQATRALQESQTQLSGALESAHKANQAKSEFLATMSHELRTPLNAILGFAQVLENSLSDPQQNTQARHIRQTGETLTRILNDILDVAKVESGKLDLDPHPFSLAQVIDSCVSSFEVLAQGKGLAFERDFPQRLPQLVGDPVRLQQILHNLLSNAFKFTDTGRVQLRVALVPDTPSSVRVKIEVQDSGLGMTQEQLGRIFQRFEQAAPSTASRYGGSGLGLSIVRALVSKMGGAVTAHSQHGQGSRFVLDIAFPVAETGDCTVPLGSLGQAEAPLDILVVDDFAVNRAVLRALLEQRGHRITEAEDGIQAIGRVQAQAPDLVLMDLDMPHMDGLEATRRIRELAGKAAQVPVYALTGKAFAEDIERTRQAGMQGHITKPVQLKDLVPLLKALAAT